MSPAGFTLGNVSTHGRWGPPNFRKRGHGGGNVGGGDQRFKGSIQGRSELALNCADFDHKAVIRANSLDKALSSFVNKFHGDNVLTDGIIAFFTYDTFWEVTGKEGE